MTEKEKMQQQMLYDPNSAELMAERLAAKMLCHDFNGLSPDDAERQKQILQQLLGKMKEDTAVMQPFWCDYGYNIEVGEHFFVNHHCVILDGGKVSFGDNVFIGPHCGFYTAGHPIHYQQRNKGLEYALPITVGHNVWIGGGVHVMPGASIGSNVVIGGGSVVVGHIPDNVVAAGDPCRVIRTIGPDDI